VVVAGTPMDASVDYRFDRRFRLQSVRPSDAFIREHLG
jgi:hypothetical protein